MTLTQSVTLALLSLVLGSAASAVEASPDISADQAAVVQGNDTFAVELYQHLKDQPGNLFFSPESISIALAMTFAGARGETASEMARVLHFTLQQEQLNPTLGALLKDRNASHDGYQLKEADALWCQQGYSFLPEFLATAKNNYGAALNQVSFADAEKARQTINDSVANQTNTTIRDLIQPGVLDETTRLVLTNAIYFKGDWAVQFDKTMTKNEEFHPSPVQTVKVPMMHRAGEFAYFDGGTFQALAIPYRGNELSMVVFLPNKADGLAALEQSLTSDKLHHWLDELRLKQKVVLTLPAFAMTKQFGCNSRSAVTPLARTALLAQLECGVP